MSSPTDPSAPLRSVARTHESWGMSRHVQGMVFVLIAITLFFTINCLTKVCAPRISTWEMIFFRFAFALPAILVLAIKIDGKNFLHFRELKVQITRGIICGFGFWCMFYSFSTLPLADATVLNFCAPLFAIFLGAIFFREIPSLKQLLLVGLGFLGVLFVVRPSGHLFNGASLLGLISSFCISVMILSGRWLNTNGVSSSQMSLTLALVITVLSGIFMIPTWTVPSTHDLWLLIIMGICGGLGQYFITEGFIRTSTLAGSSMMNTGPIWSVFVGYLFWHEVPHTLTFVGMIFILFSTLTIARTQARAAPQLVK